MGERGINGYTVRDGVVIIDGRDISCISTRGYRSRGGKKATGAGNNTKRGVGAKTLAMFR